MSAGAVAMGTRRYYKSSDKNTFLRGFLRSFDICGASTRYSVPKLSQKTDAEALREDWERVGGYLYYAIEQVENER